jgi:nitrogen fixation protein NifX
MEKTKVAVVSTDGIHVDEHFGKAERFLIYNMDNLTTLVEERTTEPLSVGDPNHPFDADKFNRIASLLKDCAKVYSTKIGGKPAEELTHLGVEPVVYSGTIAAITV